MTASVNRNVIKRHRSKSKLKPKRIVPASTMAKAELLTREQQTVQAIKLARRGWTSQAIGVELGVTQQYALLLVRTALDEAIATRKAEVARLTEMELLRLDAMTLGVQTVAEAGSSKAIDSALKIMDRRARYLGLDAQEKKDVPVQIIIGKEFSGV